MDGERTYLGLQILIVHLLSTLLEYGLFNELSNDRQRIHAILKVAC